VSAVALTSNLSHLAIGLGDGTVLLYRHLLQSLTTSPTALTTLPKARIILDPNERAPEAITGLGFREGPVAGDKSGATTATALFIVTTNRVLAAPVSAKGGEARVLDETGSGLGCASMDWNKREMLVARDEAIYLYSPEGRGACYAYEGPKSYVQVYKSNLVIVSPPMHPASAAVRRHHVPGTGDATDIAKIAVFDLQNKLVAYTGIFRHGIRNLFSQWGSTFVLEGNGQVSFMAPGRGM
jgi:hypothetical protein